MTSDVVELEIRGIAAGGDGVGRTDGLVVFAPRTAPGDRIRATVLRSRRFARAIDIEVLRPSPDRVAPACPHYAGDRCGGCQLQHMSEAAQRRAKAVMIRDAFERIARRPVDLPEVRHGAHAWRYRRRLTLALRRSGRGWMAGLHRFDAPDEIFALEDCRITDERVMASWREILANPELLPDAPSLRATVRLTGDGDQSGFVVEGGMRWPQASALLEAVGSLAGVWWAPAGSRGAPRLVAPRGRDREHGGASFTQVNADVAALMRAHVVTLAGARAPRHVIDAYAGVGDTAEPIARAGADVVAIEVDRAASRVCATRLPAGSRAVAERVERALPAALPAELVVLNPPRAGTDAVVTRAIEQAVPPPATVIYVSCDPATLARDVGRLPSYRVASVVGFDMFPQTAHVETVCELRLDGREAAA